MNMIKKLVIASLIVTFLGFLHLFFNQVSQELSDNDLIAIKQIQNRLDCDDLSNFKGEFACIDSVQKAILFISPNNICPTDDCCPLKGELIEPLTFINRGWGCCFDRSRFNEKLLKYLGFQTRHVFIISKKYSSFLNFVPLNQSSHAASEVKTSLGWMGIDSNTSTKLFDGQNRVFTYKEAIKNKKMKKKLVPKYIFLDEPDVIYGLYSRHGYSYAPKIPGPEFNINEIKYNFFF